MFHIQVGARLLSLHIKRLSVLYGGRFFFSITINAVCLMSLVQMVLSITVSLSITMYLKGLITILCHRVSTVAQHENLREFHNVYPAMWCRADVSLSGTSEGTD